MKKKKRALKVDKYTRWPKHFTSRVDDFYFKISWNNLTFYDTME